jgi:hypothetical protein
MAAAHAPRERPRHRRAAERRYCAAKVLQPGVDDFEVAEAIYRAAVARWPRARITLRGRQRIS